MHPGFTSGYWGSCPCWARLPLWSCVHGFHGWFPCWWCRVQTGCSPCPCGSFSLCGGQRRRQPARLCAFIWGSYGGRAVVGCFCCPCSCVLACWGSGRCFFSGGAGSPARPPPRFCSSAFGAFAVAVDFRRRLGGERRIAPRQTLQQMPPDTTERIPRTGIRAMIPGSRREWVGRQMRLYTKFCVQKAPAQLKPHRGRARADRMGNPVRKTGAKRIKSPEMPSKCARPDQRRAKRGIPNPKRPAERPKTGCQMSSRRRSARYASVLPPLAA